MTESLRGGFGGHRDRALHHASYPHLVRTEDEVGRFDPSYVGALVLLRWMILATYVLLVASGLIPMNTLALAGSAFWIFLTNVLATWYWAQRRPVQWYDNSYLVLDVLSVTFGVIASANLSYPIWLAFVMVMGTAAAEQTTRYAATMTICCSGCYLLCAGAIAAAGWYDPAPGVVAVTACIMLFVGLNMTITFDGSRRLRAYIRRLAVTDPLTGLANRRRLDETLGSAAAPVGVIVLDVDNFKRYNDSLGHLAGDRLLVALAGALQNAFEDALIISRYGGDEFVAIVPCQDEAALAGRVRVLLVEGRRAGVNASAGLALCPGDEPSADAALARADECLRIAKQAGKGALCVASQTARSGQVPTERRKHPRATLQAKT